MATNNETKSPLQLEAEKHASEIAVRRLLTVLATKPALSKKISEILPLRNFDDIIKIIPEELQDEIKSLYESIYGVALEGIIQGITLGKAEKIGS